MKAVRAISQQAVRAAIRAIAHQDAHHVHASTPDSVHVQHLLMTELTRTKAVSVPKDSVQDCRQVHSSARRIVHDIITREDIILSLSSAAATVSSAVDMDSSNAVATSKVVVADMDSSSAVDMDSSAVATVSSRMEDSILRLSAVVISSAVATSKAVVADMDSSSAVDMDSSAVATSKAVVVAMDSSAEDSVLTLQAMTQMPSTA